MQTERYGNWLQTYTGHAYYPLDPRPEDIDIHDIAHALSNTCRYGGHCSTFISVAQHSYLVSKLVPKGMELWGLLHDASEAYLVDIPHPIKEYLNIYHVMEEYCMNTIARKFNLQLPMPSEVKLADRAALKIERSLFMLKLDKCIWEEDNTDICLPWYSGDFMNISIVPYNPIKAKSVFIERFHSI